MGLLRLWLALCVVSSHSGPLWGFRFMPGSNPVVAFFILAGFFAAHVIETRYRHSYRIFYVSRLLRIWPLYLLVLFATLGLAAVAYLSSGWVFGFSAIFQELGIKAALPWLPYWILSQFFLVGQDLAPFLHLTENGAIVWSCAATGILNIGNLSLIPPAWSLALEEYFFLLAPWLERLNFEFSGAIFLAGLLAYWPLKQAYPETALSLFPAVLPHFIGGIFSYRCYQRWSQAPWFTQGVQTGMLAAFAVFIVSAGYHNAPQPCIALATALSLPALFLASRNLPWDRFLGDLSYPVYLTHWLIITFLSWMGWMDRSNCALLMLCTLGMALFLAVVVERPLRVYRQKSLKP
jgi:peptidoglycan/LPS O-acetylase OafA/YrhL